MVRVAPVKLQYNPKTLWFDPQGIELHDGDPVVVQTERGVEFGHACDIIEVDEQAVSKLRSQLKPVLRVATEDDLQRVDDLRRKGQEALPVFKRMAAAANEKMHPVMVEYLFDGDKAIFFFEAEERIDFRDLVRRLASELHVRVDMRQIGVRDEARMVGGLGHCGQELCCKRLGGEFCPVSIRMAKEQDLSLNPQKISGVCGRLMCCLRYEYDAYKDFKLRAPKVNAKIQTPEGVAKVIELDVPRETVTVKLEGADKRVTFPLSAMDAPAEEGMRPSSIGDAFDEYANPDPFAGSVVVSSFDTAGFTGTDKLASPEAHHNPTRKKKGQQADASADGQGRRRRRRRKGGAQASGSQDGAHATQGGKAKGTPSKASGQKQGQGKQRNRRKGGGQGKGQGGSQAQQTQNRTVRPGRKSSSLQGSRAEGSTPPSGATSHRTPRRRSHKTKDDTHES